MKASLCRLAVLMSLAAAVPFSTRAEDKPVAADIPAPDWVKMIDQGANDPRLKGYMTPEGVKVEIVAEDPVVVGPLALAFGDDGTPYVIDWTPAPPNDPPFQEELTFPYKDGSKRRGWVWSKKVHDVVKTLSDTKGKGVYDQSQVAFEDEMPYGLLLHDGWLYVCGHGSVRRYKQSKGEGAYDVKEVVAQGFGGVHNACGMAIGPDGRLCISGGGGDNIVEGSDGSRATALRTGAVFRCHPDGSKMETFAIGFVGPFGSASFDAVGNLFQTDNGDDEREGPFAQARLMHVAEGIDFGWRMLDGRRSLPDPLRATAAGGLPGKLPPMLAATGSRSAGVLIYDDTRFPENYRGLIFASGSTGPQAVHAYKAERKGATFAVVEQFDLLKSDDGLFRPGQPVLGPDGAVYLVDGRDDKHGRIYRLTWAGTKDQPALPPRGMDSWAKITKLGDDDLVKALASDDGSDRDHARQELARRGEKNRTALVTLFKDADQPDAAREAALGALQSMWNNDVQATVLLALEHDSNADVRRLSADALGLNAAKGDDDVHAVLLRALIDAAPEVRRSAALAMSHVAADGAADNLVNTWANDDGRDRCLSDGLVRAIENLGQPGVNRLVALGESGVEKETDKVVQAFTMMRTRPAADAIPRVLENPHLKAEQRAALVRSYGNYLLDPPLSLAPMVDYLIAHPNEDAAVKQASAEVLGAGGTVAGAKAAGWLLGLFDEKDPKLRMSAAAALAALGVGPEDARRVGQAFLDGKLPPETRPQVVTILRRDAEKDAECARLLKEIASKE